MLLPMAALQVGSCRNADDRERLAQLQAYAAQLGIGSSVDWCVRSSPCSGP
jgi:hypothetical protein